MNPMYLHMSPPQMLPTSTLNPTTASSTSAARATGKVKRGLEEEIRLPLNHKVVRNVKRSEPINTDTWWWVGLSMVGFGSLLYAYF